MCLKIEVCCDYSPGNNTECMNYRCISLLAVLGKIFAGILVDRVCRVIHGLTDNKEKCFRSRRERVDQISILKQIGKKHERKNIGSMWAHGFREGV